MALFIVSRNVLFREILASYCIGEGFEVAGSFGALSDISANARNANVVLQISRSDNIAELGIDAFRDRLPQAHIIVLKPGSMPGMHDKLLQSKVQAVISDSTSARALTGFLTVVQEGFTITAPKENSTSPEAYPLRETQLGASEALSDSDILAQVSTADALGLDMKTPADKAESASAAALSARELAVVRKLREGASNKDIAKNLNIVESTVKVHLRACYRKIGVHNRTQAAIWAATNLPN